MLAGLALSSYAAASLGTHTVDAQLMIGNDCDNPSATACVTVGAGLTVSAARPLATSSLTTTSVFTAAGRADCAAASATSARLWAIPVRLDGTRLATEPSLALTLGGEGPKPPTAVKTLVANQGLLESLDPDRRREHGARPPGAVRAGAVGARDRRLRYLRRRAARRGRRPVRVFNPQFVCSELVAAGTRSVRVHGLENGRTYQIAIVAVGVDGTPSAPSEIVEGTPGPTVGFEDLYKQGGGTAAAGCATGGLGAPGAVAVVVGALLLAFAARRRARRGPLAIVVGAGLALAGAAARAEVPDTTQPFTARADWASAPPPSARTWNVELRFAPYRPNVDDEFADRGAAIRPFAEILGLRGAS